MKKLFSAILSFLIAFSSICVGSVAATASTKGLEKEFSLKGDYAKNSAIVELKTTNKDLLKNSNYFGADIKIKNIFNFGKSGKKYVNIAHLTSSKYSTEQIIAVAKQKEDVVKAQPNYKKKALDITDDTYSKYQWALENKGQNKGDEGKDLNPESVWNKGVTSSEKVIAIVDTGFDYKNEDLKDNVWTNENTRDLPGLHGYDFANGDSNPQDDNGHGSHCAGIITATANNQKGISGVNQSAKIMALKVLDEEGGGNDSEIVAAFNYIYEAQNMGVNVASVNCSLGGYGDTDSVYKDIFDAIGKKGALICCAAGNESENNDSLDVAPANTNSPYVISVAATNEKDELAAFSNYGAETVDVAAPGTDILSTVSYDCYNPTIYNSEKRAAVSQYFKDFEDDTSGIVLTKGKETQGTIKIEKTNEKFFGIGGSSAKVTVSDVKTGDVFYIKVPYTASGNAGKEGTVQDCFNYLALAPDYNELTADESSFLVYADVDAKDSENLNVLLQEGQYIDGKMNYWSHLNIEPKSAQKDGQNRVLTFALCINADSDEDYVIHFDDIGISKPVSDTSVFGKYDFYNGTSMATPYVTGSVALLNTLHKDLNPIQLKALVMNSVRKTDELKTKTVAGGVLDLSKALTTDSVAPVITSATSENNKVTVEGVYFGDAPKAYINGEEATIVSSSDTKVVVDASGFAYKNVKVAIENVNGTATIKTKVIGVITKFSTASYTSGDGSQLVSDGTNLFLIDPSNLTISLKNEPRSMSDFDDDYDSPVAVGRYLANSKDAETYEYFEEISTPPDVDSLYPEFKDDDLMKGYLYCEGNACYLNNKLWFITNLYTAGNHYKLVSFSFKTFKWTVEGNLPDDKAAKQYTNSMLAAYNGKIYLLGGVNVSNLENGIEDNFMSKMVRVFNEKTDKWSSLADMPEGRALSDVRQIGNKLVVSFGWDGSLLTKKQDLYYAPKTMIFDGSKWTVSNAQTPAFDSIDNFGMIATDEETDFVYDVEFGDFFETRIKKVNYKMIPAFQVSGGISSDSVIYTGKEFSGMGQFASYNLSTNKFSPLSYYLKDNEDYEMIGTSVGGKYYIYNHSINDDDDDDDDDDYALGFKSAKDNDTATPKTDKDENNMYSFSIKTGNVKITKSKVKGGTITGAGEYLPGQNVTITAKADKTHKFASLTVDGKKYTKNSVSVLTSKNITVSAKFSDIAVKSIKLNFKKKTLNVKKKVTIKVKYNPTNATVKTVKFTSSNKKVASVNKKGVVTAKSAGKAVITVKTKNGKKAKCTIIVKQLKK